MHRHASPEDEVALPEVALPRGVGESDRTEQRTKPRHPGNLQDTVRRAIQSVPPATPHRSERIQRSPVRAAPAPTSIAGRVSRSTSSADTIRRYRTVPSDGYALTAGAAETAPAPFTRVEEETSVMGSAEEGFGMGWKSQNDAKPDLLVSSDNTLAINALAGESKEFYATAAAITNAQAKLDAVGSPIVLRREGNSIKINGDAERELFMVRPALRSSAPPGIHEFISLAVDICRDSTKQIIGGALSHGVLNDGAGEKRAVAMGFNHSTKVSGVHEIAEAVTNGAPSLDEARTAGTDKTAEDAPNVGEQYGRAQAAGELDAKSNALGINKAAQPSVGQGYVTQSIFDAEGSKTDYAAAGAPTDREFVWGYHFSSVVAEALDGGGDQITMENYARKTDINEGKAKLLSRLKEEFAGRLGAIDLDGTDEQQIGRILHATDDTTGDAGTAYKAMYDKYTGDVTSMWYFRMVGTGAGQTFHEQMSESGYFVNPLTMAVANRFIATTGVWFEEGSSEITAPRRTSLLYMVPQIEAAIRQGLTPKIRLTGYASGYKGSGKFTKKMGLARANAVKDALVAGGAPAAIFTVEDGGRLDDEDRSMNRHVKVEVIE